MDLRGRWIVIAWAWSHSNRAFADERAVRHARFGIGMAGFVQNPPPHRQGYTLVGNPQNQEVKVGLAESPVRAIQGHIPGSFAHREQSDQ